MFFYQRNFCPLETTSLCLSLKRSRGGASSRMYSRDRYTGHTVSRGVMGVGLIFLCVLCACKCVRARIKRGWILFSSTRRFCMVSQKFKRTPLAHRRSCGWPGLKQQKDTLISNCRSYIFMFHVYFCWNIFENREFFFLLVKNDIETQIYTIGMIGLKFKCIQFYYLNYIPF